MTVISRYLIPSYALLDPDLIMTLPAGIAAACGVDAFIHAMEAYLSKMGNPFTDAMAEKAMELIVETFDNLWRRVITLKRPVI